MKQERFLAVASGLAIVAGVVAGAVMARRSLLKSKNLGADKEKLEENDNVLVVVLKIEQDEKNAVPAPVKEQEVVAPEMKERTFTKKERLRSMWKERLSNDTIMKDVVRSVVAVLGTKDGRKLIRRLENATQDFYQDFNEVNRFLRRDIETTEAMRKKVRQVVFGSKILELMYKTSKV